MIDGDKKEIKEIVITLHGDLMSDNSVDYRTVFDVVDGSIGAIEGFSRIANFNQVVSYRVKPPRKGSFEISIQAVQLLGVATLPIIQNAGTIKDVINLFTEYVKIKKALRGEELNKENIQTNENGDIIIKNKSGSVVYNDNRRIISVNVINNAIADPQINKKIDKIVTALEKNEQVDTILFKDPELKENNTLTINKTDVDALKYKEKFEEKADQLVGYIRMINNKTNKGIITASNDEKGRGINFEIDIKDIDLLDKVVRNLALAEADRSRVVFSGEKTLDSVGNIKKIIVNDVDIVDKSFDF